MPKLRIDGCRGTMSVTEGVGLHELCDHLYPTDNLPRVYFHSELDYLQIVSCHFNMNGVIFPQVCRSYYSYSSGGGKGGGCYITTACVEVMGLTDDCDELQTLRKFRDEMVESNFDNAGKMAAYYDEAPRIVAALDKRPDRKAFYTHVFYQYIRPAVEAIKDNNQDLALGIYAAGVAHCAKAADEVKNAGH